MKAVHYISQETRDRIDDEEADYYARREDELSASFMSRQRMHEIIQGEIDEIRRNRNDY